MYQQFGLLIQMKIKKNSMNFPKDAFQKMIDEWMYAEGDFDVNFTKKESYH